MPKHTVFVFAFLKPSQINYKIVPLSRSKEVDKVYILRKKPLTINEENIECISLPWILRHPPFYWIFTAFYGVFLIHTKKASLILSYNIFPHGFNGYLASILTKRPLIYAEIIEDTMRFYTNTLKRPIIRKILNRAERILVPGEITGRFWVRQGFNKISVLHSTIDPGYFKVQKKVQKEFDFLFVGVLDTRKRPDIILDAFIELKKQNLPVSLCIIGYGELKTIIESKIYQSGYANSIKFLSDENVLCHYQKSKILVMSSLAEGLPCAMMEAMACELLVLVPPVGDISDVIQHGVNGFLHDNSNKEIIQNMKQAYLNFDSMTQIRKNARNTIIKDHSYNIATQKWNELLSNIPVR